MLRKILILSWFGLCFLSSLAKAQDIGEYKVVLQRGDYTKIRLNLSVLSLDAPDWTTFEISSKFSEQDGIDMLTKFLDICVLDGTEADKKCGEAPKKVTYTNGLLDKTVITSRSTDYTAAFVSGATKFTLPDNSTGPLIYKLTTQIELTAANTSLPFKTSTAIAVRLYAGTAAIGSNNYKEIEGTKATLAVAVNDSPGEFVVQSSKGTLTGVWTDDEVVDLADGNKGSADGVLAFVIAEPFNDQPKITIHSYNQTDPALETTYPNSCSIVDVDGTSCKLNCVDDQGSPLPDDKYYLKTTDLQAAGYSYQESGSSNSVSITGLSKETTYAFVVQYQPDGLLRDCRLKKPSDAVTLSELGGGPEPTLKDPRCFIATAAYGSTLDPHLNSLRWFRDNALLVTGWGRSLVATYYRLSPPMAAFITEHPKLQALVRGVLWLPVVLIEFWRERPSLLLTISAMCGTVSLLFLRRRSLRASV